MLRYTADIRTLAFVATYYALIAFVYATDLPWPAWIGLMVVLCFLSFFCAVITHNTVHTPVFKVRALNRLFQVLLTPTYGHPVSMYVPGHNLSHHKYLQTPKDRMRTDKLRFRWNLLNQLLFMPVVGTAIFADNATYVRVMRKKGKAWYRQFLIETTFFLAFMAVLLVLDWQKFIVFVLIPHQYAAWGIMGINFVQHDGCDGPDTPNHSRNFTGKLVNWFTFNNGYHGIHHVHPGLHWSLAPEVHERELAPLMDPRLNQKSLFAFLFKQYIFPGKRMRYDGTPVVLGPPRADEPWIKEDPADTETPVADAVPSDEYIPAPQGA